jgi:tRNA A37 N6-isopentenylltransferase MiaA
MARAARSRQPVEVSAEQEALAQRIMERIKGKLDDELLDMVRSLVSRPPEEIFGAGEFELRDRLNQVGATLVEESVNEQAKKGVPR